MLKIQTSISKILDHDFFMSTFSEFHYKIPEFKQYLTYFYEKEKANIFGSIARKAEYSLMINEK